MLLKDQRTPKDEELEKELSEFLSKKFGSPIRVFSILTESKPAKEMDQNQQKSESTAVDTIHFDMKPEELEAYLGEYVIKQEEAKAILATKVCTHFNRIKHELKCRRSQNHTVVGRIKNNIIMIGPTGVGKTYMVKLIADKIGVPFVKGDATKFSETGYVGGDVEDLVRDLVREANDEIELAKYGIIYVDEIDKIASSQRIIGPDVSRTGVQRALLKPMEETEVDLKVPHDPISQLEAIERYRKTGKREKRLVNTRNILFIVSGAFTGLAEIIKKRVKKQGIGFGADLSSKKEEEYYLKMVKAEDFMEYGFESEFVGRLPVVAVFEELSKEDLYEILTNPKNPVTNAKRADFRAYGIDIRFEKEALRLLAERAAEEKTGARGLVSVLEKTLLYFEKKLPSTDIRFFVVTPETVIDPKGELRRLLENPDEPKLMDRYRRAFAEDKGVVTQAVLIREAYYKEKYGPALMEARIDLVVTSHLLSGTPLEDLFGQVVSMIDEVRAFERSFMASHKIAIHFSEDAIDEILRIAMGEDKKVETICLRVSKDYDYALKLVADKTGQREFVITKQGVLEPDSFINEIIRLSFTSDPFGIPGVPRG